MLLRPKRLRSLEDLNYLASWLHLWSKFCLRFLKKLLLDFLLGVFLSPVAILVALALAVRQKTVLVIGLDRLTNISLLISYLEPELRHRIAIITVLKHLL